MKTRHALAWYWCVCLLGMILGLVTDDPFSVVIMLGAILYTGACASTALSLDWDDKWDE